MVALGVERRRTRSYDYGVLLGMQEQVGAAAAEAYRKAIALNPQHARAHNNLGQILERQRQFDAAAAEYRQAVDSQPTLRIARFNLGRMLVAQSRSDDAISELQKLTEPRDAETPRYLFALAAAHMRAGHGTKAESGRPRRASWRLRSGKPSSRRASSGIWRR